MTPPKDRLYKKDYAYELLRIAESDLAAGQALLQNRVGRGENAAYFAEQVVEKCLKAVLCYRSIAFPAIHDIRQLLDYITHNLIPPPPHGHDLNELSIYGTVRRYEEGPWKLSWEEAALAHQAATDVLDWAKQMIV